MFEFVKYFYTVVGVLFVIYLLGYSTFLIASVIAGSLGFEDQLAFSKLFKKEFSLSPTEYRKYNRPGSLANDKS